MQREADNPLVLLKSGEVARAYTAGTVQVGEDHRTRIMQLCQGGDKICEGQGMTLNLGSSCSSNHRGQDGWCKQNPTTTPTG